MPVLPTDTVIEYAKISQYLISRDIKQRNFFPNQVIDKKHDVLLYLERKAVQKAYADDPTDTTLDKTNPYLLALCGAYAINAATIIAGDVCVPPSIVTNPASSSPSSGSNVTFSVVAAGSSPMFYQWKKNGTNISGANSSSLTLTAVTSGDNGSYSVSVTNACGSTTSTSATLTVSTLLTAYYWYGDTDPYPQLSSFIDALTYAGTVNFASGADISVPFPSGAANNKYEVIRYPDTETVKTDWYNTVLNNGTIPDAVFRDVLSFGGNRYIISRVAMSIDTTSNVIFSA
jgi:hypothetical protein